MLRASSSPILKVKVLVVYLAIFFCLHCFTESLIVAQKRSRKSKVATALEKSTKAEFLETPLTDVAKFLSQSHKIPISLDVEAMTIEGLAEDESVTAEFSGISLASALKILLEPYAMTYLADNSGLKLTTEIAAEKHLEVRLYDVRSLLGPQGDASGLVDVIMSCTTGPWREIDGTGGVTEIRPGAIAVSQTQSTHAEIDDLFRKLLRIANPRNAPRATVVEKSEEKIFKALDKTVKVDFQKTPLKDAIDFLQSASKLQIVFDRGSLAEEGVKDDSAVTAEKSAAALSEVLTKILKPLDLTWIVEDEVIKVTTKLTAEARLETRVYDARRLIGQKFTADQFIEGIMETAGTGPWEEIDGAGGSIRVIGGLVVIRQSQQTQFKIAELMKRFR